MRHRFFDESGHSASTHVVAIGGAMATPKRWGSVRERWTTTLNKFDVKSLHMTDFENRQGEFAGWDENRRRHLLSELFEAITGTPLIFIGAAVVVEDFNRLDVSTRKKLMDPWYLCYQSCFVEVLSMDYLFNPADEDIEPFQKPWVTSLYSGRNKQLKAELLRPFGQRSDLLLAISGFVVFGAFVDVLLAAFDEPVVETG
jgi:hypothetical protein